MKNLFTNLLVKRFFFLLNGKSWIQQKEESFYQQVRPKFEEETSKMLHLEHGFVWC
jgi:hypothetical protein